MLDFIYVHEKVKAKPDGLPNLAEATAHAADNNAGLICYEKGKYWIIWFDGFGLCTYPLPHWRDCGETIFLDDKDNPVAIRLKEGTTISLLEKPPYLSFSPCPWCSCLNNRGHDPLKHIDPFLGEKI